MKKLTLLFLLISATAFPENPCRWSLSPDTMFYDSAFIQDMNGHNWIAMEHGEKKAFLVGFYLGQMGTLMYLGGHEYISSEVFTEVCGPETIKLDWLYEFTEHDFFMSLNLPNPILPVLMKYSQALGYQTRKELEIMWENTK